MPYRRRHPGARQWLPQWGYTLIEGLAIALVVGILAAVAVPNLGAMLDSVKVSQSVTELQTSFQDAQRQAIRKGQTCTVKISGNRSHSLENPQLSDPMVEGNCLPSGSTAFPVGVSLATNLQQMVAATALPTAEAPTRPSPLPRPTAEVKFSAQGSAEFSILSTVKPPLVPQDPTGKIVALLPDKPNIQKRCVAISSTLGLTRIGVYKGGVSPIDITDTGVCTALDWKQQ